MHWRWGALATPAHAEGGCAGLDDGSYDLVLRSKQGEHLLGDTALAVWLVAGLDRDLAGIERGRATLVKTGVAVPEDIAASLAYPGNLAVTLSARTRQIRDVAFRPLLDSTLALLAAAGQGRNPLADARGGIERHFWNAAAGRIEPYRVITPVSGPPLRRAQAPLLRVSIRMASWAGYQCWGGTETGTSSFPMLPRAR